MRQHRENVVVAVSCVYRIVACLCVFLRFGAGDVVTYSEPAFACVHRVSLRELVFLCRARYIVMPRMGIGEEKRDRSV